MTGFDEARALIVFGKLRCEVERNTHHVYGIVNLTNTHRIRLYFSMWDGVVPPSTESRWRQDLKLDPDEFFRLHDCTLSGEQALNLTRQRLGL